MKKNKEKNKLSLKEKIIATQLKPIIDKIIYTCYMVYIEDITAYTNNEKTHEEFMKEVLEKLKGE